MYALSGGQFEQHSKPTRRGAKCVKNGMAMGQSKGDEVQLGKRETTSARAID